MINAPRLLTLTLLLMALMQAPLLAFADENSIDSQSSIDQELVIETQIFLNTLVAEQLHKIESATATLSLNATKINTTVAQLTSLLANSKRFVSAAFRVAALDYPDVLALDAILRVTRVAVVYPALVATGYGFVIPFMSVSPDMEFVTGSYLAFKIWRAKVKMRRIYGINSNQRLKALSEIFDQEFTEDLRLDLSKAGADWVLLPIRKPGFIEFSRTLKNSRLINMRAMTEIIADPTYTQQARKQISDSTLLESVYLQKILSDSEMSQRLAGYLGSATPLTELSPLALNLTHLAQLRARVQFLIEQIYPSTRLGAKLFKPRGRTEWREARLLLRSASQIRSELEKIEMQTLSQWVLNKKSEPEVLAAQLQTQRESIDKLTAQANVYRASGLACKNLFR